MADTNDLPPVLGFSQDIADAKPPAPLPVGSYRAIVKNAVNRLSQKQKRMMVLEMWVSPDQYPADYTDGNPDGTMLSYFVPAEDTPQGRWNVKKACEVFGVPMSRDIPVTEFMSREVMIKVTHEMYEGNPQARIERNGLSAL